MFECPNCCEEYKIGSKNKKIICEECKYETCNHCQKRYSKSECMSCHREFTKTQIETLLGKKYVEEVIIKNQIEDIITEEKKLIPATEELIEYKKELERRHKLFRKGKQAFETMPTRPIIVSRPSLEPCSINNCKGYLRINPTTNIYGCMLCLKHHCVKCLILIDGEHTCDPKTLESIKELDKETRKCPKCYTRIYKTEGCDHMNCTSCGTHFSWNTGVILGISSNHHYRHLIRNTIQNNNGICIHDYKDPAIPMDILEIKLTDETKYDLYTYPNKIRIYYNEECNYEKIITNKSESNDELRIRYMKNEITERYWGQRLYKNQKTMKMKIAHREIIELYLSGIDSIQSISHNKINIDNTEIHKEVIELINQCNECFNQVNDEYYCQTNEVRFQLSLPDMNNKSIILEKKIIRPKPVLKKVSSQPTIQKVPIKLFEYQQEHYNKISEILEKYHIGFDLSPLGAGKTYITCKYLQEHPCENMYIICPATLKPKWESVSKEYGIPLIILTYNEVASVKMRQPSHGLLRRDDFSETQILRTRNFHDDETRIVQKVRFYATEKLIEMSSKPNGIFIAFDEIQNIRNETSNTTHACREIMNEIFNKKINRLLCISGTPVDKDTQFVTIFRNIGIQRDTSLFTMNLSTWRNDPTGFNEILDYCTDISLKSSNLGAHNYCQELRILPPHNTANAHKVLHKMFINIIMPILTSSMIMPERPNSVINNYNTFYDLKGEDLRICQQAITKMLEIVDNNNGIFGEARMQLFKSMELLESAKINTFVNEVEYTLNTYPNSKVVVALSYSYSIKELSEKLKHWKPLCVNGEINAKKKMEYVNKFQTPDLTSRLLIGNINVISTGIDLDDKDGRYPRYVFVNPNFSMITIEQLNYRFLRSLDTKSNTIIRYVYTSEGIENIEKNVSERYNRIENMVMKKKNLEMRIKDKLLKKSEIMKSVSGEEIEIKNEKCSV